MIVIRDDEKEIIVLKKILMTEFNLKVLGKLIYFLNIEMIRSEMALVIN